MYAIAYLLSRNCCKPQHWLVEYDTRVEKITTLCSTNITAVLWIECEADIKKPNPPPSLQKKSIQKLNILKGTCILIPIKMAINRFIYIVDIWNTQAKILYRPVKEG